MRASKAIVALVCFGVAIGSLSLALGMSMPREATTAAMLTAELAQLHADPATLAAFASILKAQPVGLTPAQSAALAAGGPVAPNHGALAAQVNAILTDTSLSPTEKGFRLADVATRAQAASFGVAPEAPAIAAHATPSAAILALADSAGVILTPDQTAQARMLDAAPSAAALARVIDTFDAMNQAAAHDLAANPGRVAWSAETFGARLAMLDAAHALLPYSVPAQPHAAPVGPTLGVPGLIAVDLGNNNEYRDNYALSIDLGGNDLYLNNAGGNTFGNCGMVTQAAAAIDLSGDDTYAPAFDHNPGGPPVVYPDGCGKNGGSLRGVGLLLDVGGCNVFGGGQSDGINGGAEGPAALGFMLAADGEGNAYNAGDYATNGGAYNAGVGALIEAGTTPATLNAGSFGTNGGAAGAGASGLFLDGSIGTHYASGNGANGGAQGVGSVGFAAGRGVWSASWGGTNGGGSNGGAGTLALADEADGGGQGSNGGADGTGSTGSLWGVKIANAYGDQGVNGGGSNSGHGTLAADGCSCNAGSYGANGGGYNKGTGFLFDAVGGSYSAGSNGANGGADATGAGMLLVAGTGGTYYQAGDDGTNGGASNSGVGFLLDSGTAGAYHGAGSQGTNGGAYAAGVGLLLDAAGSDTYAGGSQGVNGGEFAAGSGALIDLSGNDAYTCSNPGCNGQAVGIGGTALLLDAEGSDTYNGHADQTIAPNGIGGAQIDLA